MQMRGGLNRLNFAVILPALNKGATKPFWDFGFRISARQIAKRALTRAWITERGGFPDVCGSTL